MNFPFYLVALLISTRSIAAGIPSGDSQIHGHAGTSEIVITTTSRVAGAIHSLTWDGMEFIDSTDHGRQLQSACSFDNSRQAQAETFNPTEAGSRKDGAGATSTSRLLEISANRNHLRTRTQMSFWLNPGETSAGQRARNHTALSDYLLTKNVKIGYEKWSQALDYQVQFTVPKSAQHKTAQFEALTGYLPATFEKFWQFNLKTKHLEPLSDGPGEIKQPIVMATSDGSHAIGIFARKEDQYAGSEPNYGRWRFTAEKVVKWNCVFRVNSPNAILTGNFNFHMLIPIGTLKEVETMLRDWN